MIRILTLDWSKVGGEKNRQLATGRLLRFIAAHGGMLSEDSSVFVTEGLDRSKEYEIIKRIMTQYDIHAYERVNVSGFDGAGRIF